LIFWLLRAEFDNMRDGIVYGGLESRVNREVLGTVLGARGGESAVRLTRQEQSSGHSSDIRSCAWQPSRLVYPNFAQ
jgi:hypothetical protein